jgi:hypothetical protein
MHSIARWFPVFVALVLVVGAHARGGQDQAPGTVAVVVREAVTGRALPDVRITAMRAGSAEPVFGITSDDGTAELTLAPGKYRISAQSPDHLTGYPPHGMVPSPSQGLAQELGIAQAIVRTGRNSGIALELPRASSIQGFVASEDGRPLRDIDVDILRVIVSAGDSVLARAASGKTDDAGRFRLTGLRAGDYVVRVRFGSQARPAYNDVYYPGVGDLAKTTPVTLGPAHDASIAIAAPLLPLGSITGRVTGAGSAPSRVELAYQRLGEDTGCVILIMSVPISADGRFAISGLPSGRYALRAEERGEDETAPRSGAARFVEVGTTALSDVDLQLVPFASIRGRFEFQGTAPKPKLFHGIDVVAVGPDAAGRYGPSSRYVDQPMPDAFGVDGILGLNRLYVAKVDGWVVEAAVLADGTDIHDTPYAFEPGRQYTGVRIVLSDRTASIVGRVILKPGEAAPSSGMSIAAFPDDPVLWTRDRREVFQGTVQDDGWFVIPDVRPGRTYLVAAYPWQAATAGDDWYAALARSAARIFVSTPGVHVKDVRLIR